MIKNNLKKIIIPLGVIITTFATFSVVSCGKKSDEPDFSKIFTNNDKILANTKKCKIINWIDGDTLKYKDETDGSTHNLRVQLVDTPESHVKDGNDWLSTTGVEKEWADKATAFGQHEMPAGTEIKVVFGPGMTFGRKVGSIFYGKDFSKNYEFNLVKAGLAYPFSTSITYAEMEQKTTIQHYLCIPLGNAYQYAKINHIGINNNKIEASKIHGKPNLSVYEHNPVIGHSVFDYDDVDFW